MNDKKILTDMQKDIIISMAKNNMIVEKVSRDMMYHRGTILYHIDCIQQKTGLSPKKFYDLVKLLKMIEKDI